MKCRMNWNESAFIENEFKLYCGNIQGELLTYLTPSIYKQTTINKILYKSDDTKSMFSPETGTD